MLDQTLNDILQFLQQHRPETVKTLQPGLTLAQIQERVRELPFHLPEDVYALYQWRNGAKVDLAHPGASDLMPHFEFLSLEQAIAECKEIEDFRKDCQPFSHEENTDKPWFPIFGVDDGEYLLVFGDTQVQQKQSIVLHCHLGGGSLPKYRYASVCNLMKVINRAYRTGAYYLDFDVQPDFYSTGYLSQDDAKMPAIELEVEGPDRLDNSLTMLSQEPMTLDALCSAEREIRRYKDPRAVVPLVRLLNIAKTEIDDNEHHETIRFRAAGLLGNIGDPRAIAPLINALEEQLANECNLVIMGAIAQSLSQLGDSSAIPSIEMFICYLRSINGYRCLKNIVSKWKMKKTLFTPKLMLNIDSIKTIATFYWNTYWDIWSEVLCETCIQLELLDDAKRQLKALKQEDPPLK